MTGYCFTSGEELIDICKKEGLTISEVMLRRQQELSDDTAENILKELKTTLHAMKRRSWKAYPAFPAGMQCA